MLDLLVVGAGLSGLCAALAAAEAGQSVRIVARGMGALHWAAGSLDLLGYLPGSPLAVDDPLKAIASLHDEHPYCIAGKKSVGASLERFAGWLRAEGSVWFGADEAGRNMLLPSPIGAVRPVFFAPAAQKAGEILPAAGGGAPMVIVGVSGMRDFYPMLIAENLNRQGYRARAAFIPWESVSARPDRNTVQLAQGLENRAQLSKVIAALKGIVHPGERVGLPALLGMDEHARVLQILTDTLNASVFEIPTLPPSVPGIRLYRTLAHRLERLGVRIETNMEAIGVHASDGAIAYVETATASRPLRHTAKRFLLATGGILGGGFVGGEDGIVRETVFGLPLTVPEGRDKWFRPRFFDEAGQPVFRGGVSVNENFQPLDPQGNRVYDNLWAAGGALSGADPLVEHSLEGIAIATGIAAT